TRLPEVIVLQNGVVVGDVMLLEKARSLLFEQLRQADSHIRKQDLCFHRLQVGIGKITIVMCAFLGAQEKGLASGVIPTTRFLLQLLAAFKRFDLSRYFVS